MWFNVGFFIEICKNKFNLIFSVYEIGLIKLIKDKLEIEESYLDYVERCNEFLKKVVKVK